MLETYRKNKVLDELEDPDEPQAEMPIVYATRLTRENFTQLLEMTVGVAVEEKDPFDSGVIYPAINVPTPTGMKRLSEGDYLIIKDDKFFVMKPNKFEFSFTKIEN